MIHVADYIFIRTDTYVSPCSMASSCSFDADKAPAGPRGRHTKFMARCKELFRRRQNHDATLILQADASQACAPTQLSCNNAYSLPQTLPECMFLTRLPPEIRLLIYAYVFGHRSTYFTFHKRSTPPEPGYTNFYGDVLLRNFILAESDLNLLQTCKKIYTEAKPTGLNSILFHIIQPIRHPEAARKPLLAADLGSRIRHLKVRWVYCNEPQMTAGGIHYGKTYDDAWEELWATVAGVCGSTIRTLRSMKIDIQIGRGVETLDADVAEWLRPLRQIRGVRGLEVKIWNSKNTEDVMCEGLSRRLCEIMSN